MVSGLKPHETTLSWLLEPCYLEPWILAAIQVGSMASGTQADSAGAAEGNKIIAEVLNHNYHNNYHSYNYSYNL